MAMNLARTATAGVVGVASAALENTQFSPLSLGSTTKIGYSAIFEVVALLGAVGMQYFSPYTAPNVVDGATDGALALAARRGTKYALHQASPSNYGYPQVASGWAAGRPQLAAPSAYGFGRGQIGNSSSLQQKKRLV